MSEGESTKGNNNIISVSKGYIVVLWVVGKLWKVNANLLISGHPELDYDQNIVIFRNPF